MCGSHGPSRNATLIGAFTGIWMCGAGVAWAGDGGGDFASIQTSLNTLCSFLNIASCPQLPTFTQMALQIAGLENTSPDIARYGASLSPTAAINAVNPPAGPSMQLANLTPLAFVSPSTSSGMAEVTVPGDPAANSFFYAATNGAPLLPPSTLNLFYDYPPLTNPNFAKGQYVANLSVPLAILHSDSSETEAPTTIQIRGATGCGKTSPCVSATAVGSFGSVSADSLGITVTLAFQTSPNSATLHAVFQVQAPLLVTHANDPAYFTQTDKAYPNPSQFFYPLLPTSFINDELGFTPKSLGLPIGLAPAAAPRCPGNQNCTASNSPPASNFPLCASITDNTGVVHRAVAAFFSIGTIGTTNLSAPLVTPQGVTCPF
jgi:hypothetical protein